MPAAGAHIPCSRGHAVNRSSDLLQHGDGLRRGHLLYLLDLKGGIGRAQSGCERQTEAQKTRCCHTQSRPAKEQCRDCRGAHLVGNNINPALYVLWVDLACESVRNRSGREVDGGVRHQPSINRPAAATARAAHNKSCCCLVRLLLVRSRLSARVVFTNPSQLTRAGPRQQAGDKQHSERRPHNLAAKTKI